MDKIQIEQLSDALFNVLMDNKEIVTKILNEAAKNGGQISFREE